MIDAVSPTEEGNNGLKAVIKTSDEKCGNQNSNNIKKVQEKVDKEDEVVCAPVDEAEKPLAMRAPVTPSAKEVEEHELTHCPYRAWCDHCVRGQAKDTPHGTVRGDLGESSVTRVVMDYCFLNEDVTHKTDDHQDATKAKTSATVLAMVETSCMSVWSYMVENKGSGDGWIGEQINEDLETIGIAHERIIVKSDQEPSIIDVAKDVARARQMNGTAIEHSKVGDSNSNGKVERAIQDLKGLIRTLKSALEEKLNDKIKLEDPIVPWLVRHAGHLITRCRVRENGRTSYQMMKGRRSNAKLVPFGEVVLFKIPKTQHKVGSFEDRWETGVWIGFIMRTGEHVVATSKGAFRVATVMRRAADKRWSADMVRQMAGTPQHPVPGAVGRRIPAFAKKFEDEKPEKSVYIPVPEVVQDIRAAYIYKHDVDKHGATPRCPGCKALSQGARYRAKHTPECRERFERILTEADGGERFKAAKRRRDEHDERETQKVVDESIAMESDRLQRPVGEDDPAIGKSVNVEGQPEQATEITVDPPTSPGGGNGDDGNVAASSNSGMVEDGNAASSSGAVVVANSNHPRGAKRPGEEADDSSRARDLNDSNDGSKQGVKRKPDESDDSARMANRSADMSTITEMVNPSNLIVKTVGRSSKGTPPSVRVENARRKSRRCCECVECVHAQNARHRGCDESRRVVVECVETHANPPGTHQHRQEAPEGGARVEAHRLRHHGQDFRAGEVLSDDEQRRTGDAGRASEDHPEYEDWESHRRLHHRRRHRHEAAQAHGPGGGYPRGAGHEGRAGHLQGQRSRRSGALLAAADRTGGLDEGVRWDPAGARLEPGSYSQRP